MHLHVYVYTSRCSASPLTPMRLAPSADKVESAALKYEAPAKKPNQLTNIVLSFLSSFTKRKPSVLFLPLYICTRTPFQKALSIESIIRSKSMLGASVLYFLSFNSQLKPFVFQQQTTIREKMISCRNYWPNCTVSSSSRLSRVWCVAYTAQNISTDVSICYCVAVTNKSCVFLYIRAVCVLYIYRKRILSHVWAISLLLCFVTSTMCVVSRFQMVSNSHL